MEVNNIRICFGEWGTIGNKIILNTFTKYGCLVYQLPDVINSIDIG
jgi:hypothetical protein